MLDGWWVKKKSALNDHKALISLKILKFPFAVDGDVCWMEMESQLFGSHHLTSPLAFVSFSFQVSLRTVM